MSHSLLLATFLLSLVSTQASQHTDTGKKSDQPKVVAKTRAVVVLEDEKGKGLTNESFCKKALKKPDPTAVILVSGSPIPVAEYCKEFAPYATHNGGSTGNPHIKYNEGVKKNKWLSPVDFCKQEKPENCDKPIKILYEGVIANTDRPTKSLGAYCTGYKVHVGCILSE